MRGTSAGQAVVNVFHVKCVGTSVPQGDVEDVLTDVRTAYQTQLVPRLNGNWSGDTATGVDLSNILGAFDQQALGGTPGAVGTTVPNSSSVCISWKIFRHYRGGHPRTYLGPVAANALEGPTTFTSAYTGLVQAAAEAFLTAVNAVTTSAGSVYLCAVHRWQNGEVLNPPQISPIIGVAVDTRLDTMRRRLGPDR